VVHDWIANNAGVCHGTPRPWTPPGVPAVASAPTTAPARPSRTRIFVATGGRLRIFDSVSHALRRIVAPFGTGYTGPLAVAVGAVNHDGVADVAVAEGAGSAS